MREQHKFRITQCNCTQIKWIAECINKIMKGEVIQTAHTTGISPVIIIIKNSNTKIHNNFSQFHRKY